MLLLFFVLLFFLTSERSDEKKKYLKCQNNSSNTSEFPHNKIYFQFLAVLFPHFFSLFVLSHSPKFFCVFYFCQAAIRHQASNTLKLNWRQFKVRIKSLSCNYNNDKKWTSLDKIFIVVDIVSSILYSNTSLSTKLKRFHEKFSTSEDIFIAIPTLLWIGAAR